MNIYDQLMDLLGKDEVSAMALFTAYIDHLPGYEMFCGGLPVEWFDYLKHELRMKDDLQNAFRESAVLSMGVETFLEKACASFEMWRHLLDGTEKILDDQLMRDGLFNDDRYFVEGMYSLWNKGLLNEKNWRASVEEWGKNSVLSGVVL